MFRFIVEKIVRPKWVVFEYAEGTEGDCELGFSIFGVVIGLYKGDTIYPDKPRNIRAPGKREFGESLYKFKEI